MEPTAELSALHAVLKRNARPTDPFELQQDFEERREKALDAWGEVLVLEDIITLIRSFPDMYNWNEWLVSILLKHFGGTNTTDR